MHEWRLVYTERPWTTNAERTWHYHKRAKIVKEWREAFFVLAKEAKVQSCHTIEVVATPHLDNRGRIQDVAACHPAVKAAIDGLVDAGVIRDDGPKYLKAITFKAPVLSKTVALELIVRQIV